MGRQHKLKKKPHFKKPDRILSRCKLIGTGIQDETGFRFEPGATFYCEQKYDGKGQAYIRVYRTKDAESFWPFSLPDFYHVFKIVR